MSTDVKFSGSIFRKDHPMILAANRHLASIKPVRLAYDSSGYAAGVVLAKNSVSGMFQKYDDGASSGLNTAQCILFEDVKVGDFESSSDTRMARAVIGGELKQSLLSGLDAAAIVDLKARSFTSSTGTQILKF